ncbi:hypothetical protein GCM10022261_28570 [Brevibacterium daeguense]|uniref:L,D-TPase catalytic domain-containing protein n=2 Tax=Brevibacterium daeguense TaxID=909936 RepID=A0ABP8EN51_9MICO
MVALSAARFLAALSGVLLLGIACSTVPAEASNASASKAEAGSFASPSQIRPTDFPAPALLSPDESGQSGRGGEANPEHSDRGEMSDPARSPGTSSPGGPASPSAGPGGPASPSAGPGGPASPSAGPGGPASPSDSPSLPGLPGIGPETMAEVPAESSQVLISTTPGIEDTNATTALYERNGEAWTEARRFVGHHGGNGWREDRKEGDRTSPIGVFALTDAGGYLPDPGSKLPYTQDDALRSGAAAVYGEDWADVFSYVIAINYNRAAGTPPTDDTRPMGWDAGGKIWLHVDHDSPTQGCVTMQAEDMEFLLRTMDPERTPHIIMGPADAIGR